MEAHDRTESFSGTVITATLLAAVSPSLLAAARNFFTCSQWRGSLKDGRLKEPPRAYAVPEF